MSETLKNTETKVKKSTDMNYSDEVNDVLLSFKLLVDNYAISLNEASNKNIYKLYKDIFDSSSKVQQEIFELLFKKGWYSLETAEEDKIEKAYNKFNKKLKELNSDN